MFNMPAIVGIAWGVYGIVAVTLSIFSIGFTRYYQHKRESEPFATVVTIISLALIFSTVALLPVDIFLVSSTVNQKTGLKKDWADPDTIYWMTFIVQAVYYTCYGLIALFSFVIIPFAYFFYEEYDEDQTLRDRVLTALKYTSFFVVIWVLLFLTGLFAKPSSLPPKMDLDWFKNLLTESNGEKSISFVIACLFLLGMMVFIVYTAPGLSLLPFSLIKGRRRIDTENEDVENRLAVVRERRRAITAKYTASIDSITERDQREIDNLDDLERILRRRQRTIQEDKSGLWQRLLAIIRPFEVIFGVVLLGLTLVVVASIFLTVVDKITYSICGHQCGYIISHPDLFNPINYIFVSLARVFPLDYAFMVLLVLYFFMATMSGVITIGVRFMWVSLYRIRKGATMPQGLLITAFFLTLSLLALNYSLTNVVAPGYSHFGSQVFCNYTEGGQRNCTDHTDKIVPCDIYAPTEICTPTVSSTFIDRIIVNTPFFGIFFYYSQWAFLTVFIFGFIVSLFRPPRNNVDADSFDEEEDLEEQERGLLDHNPRRIESRNYGTSIGQT